MSGTDSGEDRPISSCAAALRAGVPAADILANLQEWARSGAPGLPKLEFNTNPITLLPTDYALRSPVRVRPRTIHPFIEETPT